MTKGEVVDFLEKCRWWFEPFTSEKEQWNEALDIAIEALSADAEQVTGKLNNRDDSFLTVDAEAVKERKSKLDLISRSRAIKEVSEWATDILHPKNLIKEDAIGILESLPSADLKKMVGCTGCEHYDQQQTAMICRECRRYYKDKHSDFERREP